MPVRRECGLLLMPIIGPKQQGGLGYDLARSFSWLIAAIFCIGPGSGTVAAQTPPQAKGDPREAIALSPVETEKLLAGMRTYLETIQGIVAAMAENDVARVAAIASGLAPSCCRKCRQRLASSCSWGLHR